jgi:hypothetical protein
MMERVRLTQLPRGPPRVPLLGRTAVGVHDRRVRSSTARSSEKQQRWQTQRSAGQQYQEAIAQPQWAFVAAERLGPAIDII